MVGLAALGMERRSYVKKLQSAITRNQAILAGLPAHSLAAGRLAEQIEVAAFVYSTGWVSPQARLRAGVSVLVSAGLAGFAILKLLGFRHQVT